MKAVDFDYRRAASLEEACGLLAGAKDDARLIAGGQTLVPLMAMRLVRPSLLIDINRIAALIGIDREGDEVIVRACTRQAAALADPTVRRDVPLLAKALGFVGHVQTRNRGTVGGSIANADPAAEIGLAALALDAEVRVQSAKGVRVIPFGRFIRGAMETDIAAEECLTEIRFPVWRGARIGTGFQEVAVRHSDFALAAAAVKLELDHLGTCHRAVLAIGGAGAVPQRVAEAEHYLLGTRLGEHEIAHAASLAGGSIATLADPHASPRYRKRIAAALAARALAEAREVAMQAAA